MGLERFDLIERVRPIFGIDLYEPKMGTIEEIAIISFLADSEYAADDLCNFIDKGVVPDVMDSEPAPGPNPKGQYLVYVELRRNDETALNILKLLRDTQNITNISDWWFHAYPDADKAVKLTPESLLKIFLGNKFKIDDPKGTSGGTDGGKSDKSKMKRRKKSEPGTSPTPEGASGEDVFPLGN